VPTTVSIPANGSVPFTLFRQATFPAWGPVNLSGTAAQFITYRADYPKGGAAATTPLTVPLMVYQDEIFDPATANRTATPDFVGISNASGWPLNSPLIGRDNTKSYTYVPGGYKLVFIVTAGDIFGATVDFNVNFEIWTAPGEARVTAIDGSIGSGLTGGYSASVSLDGNFYHGTWVVPRSIVFSGPASIPKGVKITVCVTRIDPGYSASSSTRGIVTVNATPAATSLFPLCEAVEFKNSKLPWYSTRTTAAAMLITNVTQVVNKAGTVLAGRLAPAVQCAWEVDSTDLNQLHPSEKAFLPLESGFYTYVPPSTDLQVFRDYTSVTDPTSPAVTGFPVFDLSSDALYNSAYLTAGPVAESMAVTIDWHIEFRTTSALFSIASSNLTLEALHQAQLGLVDMGFFFDNVNHKSILHKVMLLAKKYVPEGISMLNPVAGKWAKRAFNYAANTRLLERKRRPPQARGSQRRARGRSTRPRNGPTTVRTTTAAGAGYNGPKKKGGLEMMFEKYPERRPR